MDKIFLVAMCFCIPLLINLGEKRFRPIQWLSPVVCCYLVGIVLGNVLGPLWDQGGARSISEVSVLFALPLLLFSTNLVAWLKLAKKTLLSFVIVIVSVMICSFVVGTYFRADDPEAWKMAGMLVGVYTGGNANLMAIGRALEVREEATIMLNAVDMVFGGSYLLFIMSIGVKMLAKILPAFDHANSPAQEGDLLNWGHLSFKLKFFHTVFLFILSGLSVGLSLLVSQVFVGEENASVIILSITTLAVIFSFSPKIRYFEGSQELGNYLLLVFCVSLGSQANLDQMVSGSLWYFKLVALIMFGSIGLHFLCCFFLKIDRDTAIITSMAGIFGPAFVAPMSQVLKNRAILFSGVTTGLVGLAVGNFAGLIIAYLLKGS